MKKRPKVIPLGEGMPDKGHAADLLVRGGRYREVENPTRTEVGLDWMLLVDGHQMTARFWLNASEAYPFTFEPRPIFYPGYYTTMKQFEAVVEEARQRNLRKLQMFTDYVATGGRFWRPIIQGRRNEF